MHPDNPKLIVQQHLKGKALRNTLQKITSSSLQTPISASGSGTHHRQPLAKKSVQLEPMIKVNKQEQRSPLDQNKRLDEILFPKN